MLYRTVAGIILLAVVLCGCDRQTLIKKFTTPEDEQAARTYFENIRTGTFAPLLAATDSSFRQQMTPAVLKSMRDVFGEKPIKSVMLIDAKVMGQKLVGQPGMVMHWMLYQYDMGDHFVVGDISLQDIGGRAQIEGIHVQSLRESIEQTNAFTLSGKSGLFLAFLALVILMPIFIIATAIICWRTPIPRRKWLWRIFVLFGIAELTLNWTTGALGFQPINVQLLGAGFIQQGYGPWTLQLSVPVGGALFWMRRRKWLDEAEANKSPSLAALS